MTAEQRFERIEANLERLAEGMVQITGNQKAIQAAQIEREAAQLNQAKTHTRLEGVVADLSAIASRISRFWSTV